MTVLVDTSVILDYLLTREPYFHNAFEVLDHCRSEKVNGFAAYHALPALWSVLSGVPEGTRRDCLADLCRILRVTAASHREVLRAVKMKSFQNFDACLTDRCASRIHADFIITRNTEDFENSEVPAITPAEFLNRIYVDA